MGGRAGFPHHTSTPTHIFALPLSHMHIPTHMHLRLAGFPSAPFLLHIGRPRGAGIGGGGGVMDDTRSRIERSTELPSPSVLLRTHHIYTHILPPL